VNIIAGARVSEEFGKDPAFVRVIDNLAGTLLENQSQLRRYVKDRNYLFREGEPDLIEQFIHNSHIVVFRKTIADKDGSYCNILEETANAAESLPKDRNAIEVAFKKILGSDTQ
jgi:hypothetical protein